MGVPIDSIQIDIESNSTSATSGIDGFISSLERLKQSSKLSVVTKRLNDLSNTVKGFSDANGAATALGTLANAIEKLRGAGSIASQAKNLTLLQTALRNLETTNVGNAAPKLKELADALAPLSAVKSGGFGTLINSLAKLGDVTKKLDDKTISDFAEKIEILNKKLDPFAKKMTTVKEAFGAINTSARKAADGVEDFDHGIKTGTLNMASFTQVAETAWNALQGMIDGFANVVHKASQWDGIEYQFGNTFGEQADLYYEKITQITDALSIDKQMFMENAAMAGSMLIGFGVDKSDAREMGLGYTELAYDIWAAFNNVYETLDGADGAMAAIRSAIAGEVEPIRRAGFTVVESTLEQTAANHGLEISIEKATEAQKSYLRYLTLVDQAHAKGIVGTYASEMETAEGMMRTFSQQLKSLSHTFGSLFLPILVKVMPWVQAFVSLISDAVYWLANFFGIDIQPVDFSDYTTGASNIENIGDAAGNASGALNDATKAAKELKNATLGIDELNVISPSSATGGSGGSGGDAGGSGAGGGFSGLDVESLWDKSIYDSVQQSVDEIKKKIQDMLPLIAGVATAFAGMRLTSLLKDLDDTNIKLQSLGKAVTIAGIIISVGKLVWDFTGAYLEGGDEMDLLKAFGATTIGTALAYWLGGKPGAAITLAVSGIVTLSRLAVELKEGTVEWSDPEAIMTGILGGVETIIGAIFTWKTLSPIIKKAWPKIAAKATPLLAKAGPYGWIATAVIAGVTLSFVDYDFTEIGRTIGEKIGEGLRAAGQWLASAWDQAWNWIYNELEIENIWDELIFLFVPGANFASYAKLLDEPFQQMSDWINEKINNLFENIREFVGGFFEGLFDGLGLDMTWAEDLAAFFNIDILEAFINPRGIGGYIIDGILDGMWNSEFATKLRDMFGSFVDGIKSFFGIHSPSALMRDEIGSQLIPGITSGMSLTGIRDRLSSVWENAKSWWNTKKEALKTYTPSIGNISSNLSSAWESAKKWWKEKRSSLSYTPSIGKIWENLKSAWTNAKNWWNEKRSSLSYTPSIGSISSKLSSAWTTAKNWWNKNRSSLSYTPSIGSIKDKVVSAWNSAKSWWSKNVGGLSTKLNISVPKLTVNWGEVSALGKTFKYPKSFSVKFAADGGVFDKGSLIWAGERGPEIMANAGGGRTGVMNVQQMQEAVYEGVFAAVSAAMRGNNGGSQVVKVYLDGKDITSTVEKTQRERGTQLMGNEVYSY